MLKSFSFPDSGGDELKPTKDGLGWVCVEDIDVTRIDETDVVDKSTKDGEVEEEKSLEDEIGEGMYCRDLEERIYTNRSIFWWDGGVVSC